jgi:Zn-dependent M28 family amino/carboxypeptidase
MSLTRQLVSIGPRPPGSAGIDRAGKWIAAKAVERGLKVETDSFRAQTPLGEIEMKNLSILIPGRGGKNQVVLLAHYDSKRYVGFDFVGANDSAAAVALLLAMTGGLKGAGYPFDVRIVFVDGEEALVFWTPQDSLYGSRRFVSTLKGQKPVKAAIVLDMIGDKDLKLVRSAASDPKLQGIAEDLLKRAGMADLLERTPERVDDDHIPFVEAGIPALHVMDFTYGGPSVPGRYWHTAADTVDKLSERSLSIVGELTLRFLARLRDE